ncbi:MAG: acyl carrier protein [Ignavibacteriaceae bacterium]|jgi:acyl carrier protein|nr:acyl carrier protein [Ignavibacteriaceae bacterium]
MEIDKFIKDFAEALELTAWSHLRPDSVFRDAVEGWDSLSALIIITMIKSEYDVAIKANEFIECKTLSELFDKVESLKNVE